VQVRYLYVPLGGARRRALVIWPIFFFVALWHDLEWRLMSWAWLICLAFVPEMAIKQFARSKRFDSWRGTLSYRYVCATAATLNIAALMAANLAGFVVGLDGVAGLLQEMLRRPGFVAATLITFFSAANLMLALREWELLQRAPPQATVCK
jgi:D-alanyl-lipoteichoic acid acyltransferase DltB (MBOAT superfamily)